MLAYHIDTKVSGISIQLIESQYSYCLIYGMERTTWNLDQWDDAKARALSCLSHALNLV